MFLSSGAGNWYSPPALTSGGTFSSSTDAPPRKASDLAPQSSTQATGRGGAGNFVWGSEVKDGGKEVKAKEEAIRTDIAREVEAGLAKPGRVVLKAEGVDEVVS